jgi:hypothetical protein
MMALCRPSRSREVPERTYAVLQKRAAAAHQSLQEYLLQYLI